VPALHQDRGGAWREHAGFFREEYTTPLDERVPILAEDHTGALTGDQRKQNEQRF
jgi:hypothetical protein